MLKCGLTKGTILFSSFINGKFFLEFSSLFTPKALPQLRHWSYYYIFITHLLCFAIYVFGIENRDMANYVCDKPQTCFSELHVALKKFKKICSKNIRIVA